MACKDKVTSAAPPAAPSQNQAAALPETQPTPAGSGPVNVQAEASPEEVSSTVRVRVVLGGIPPKYYAGALLHCDELRENGTYFELNRCVLALLDGWSESQLRNPGCKFHITRNLPDDRGDFAPFGYAGQLLHFDANTGIAAIGYNQGFSSDTDVGFRLERKLSDPVSGIALRALRFKPGVSLESVEAEPSGPRAPRARGAERVQQSLIKYEFAPFSSADGAEGRLAFPERKDDRTGEGSSLFVKHPTLLAGFLRQGADHVATLVKVDAIKVSLRRSGVKTVGVAFSGNAGATAIAIDVAPIGSGMPSRVGIHAVELADGEKKDLSTLREPYLPITTQPVRWQSLQKDNPTRLQFSLGSPGEGERERTHLIQLAWSEFDDEREPSAYSAPFIVRLSNTGGVIAASTEGVTKLELAKPEPSTTRTFDLEAPVREVFEIAGGREVLLQLQGEPYWKRFSLERREWLPLPADLNSATADVSGNLSSLFVLDRTGGEVRQYRLADLTLVRSLKLDLNMGPFAAIRAGCNSDRAPLYVLAAKEVLALAPDTLRRTNASFSSKATGHSFPAEWRYPTSGDGLSLWLGEENSLPTCLTYAGDIWGLRDSYFGAEHFGGRRVGVSAAYAFDGVTSKTCANPEGKWIEMQTYRQGGTGGFPIALRSLPVTARLLTGKANLIPPEPPRVILSSMYGATSFAEVDAPEFTEVIGPNGQDRGKKFRTCFDAKSRTIGTVTLNSRKWTVREVSPKAQLDHPVLLNWPDPILIRGDAFQFSPHFLGETKFDAELLGTKETTVLQNDGKTISFKLADQELASLLLLRIKTKDSNGSEVVMPIPLHVRGAPIPYITSKLAPGASADFAAAGFTDLSRPKDHLMGLKSSYFEAPSRVKAVRGPVAGHLAMVTDERRVDFYSLTSRTIAGSMAIPEKVDFYAGCGSLFEFDAEKKALTRIKVPEGIREREFSLPANYELLGLGLGADRKDPLTLVVQRPDPPPSGFGVEPRSNWANRALLVLDSDTLRAESWMQPQVWALKEDEEAMRKMLGYFHSSDGFPQALVGSRNGRLLVFPVHLLLLSPRFSVAVPFVSVPQFPSNPYSGSGRERASGSITGSVAVSSQGRVFRNGVAGDGDHWWNQKATPCGRYMLVRGSPAESQHPSFEVRTVEGNRPLFRLNRLATFDARFDDDSIGNEVALVDDAGPLMVKAKGGKLFQFIDFDIARLAAAISPDDFHVTSQPMPCVIEGGQYTYQVTVNKAELVTGYKLRNASPNITISPAGLVRYACPNGISAPQKLQFSIEIRGKLDRTVLHEFEIITVPKNNPNGLKRAGNAL